MRISNNHGKFYFGLFMAVALLLACLVIAHFRFSPSSQRAAFNAPRSSSSPPHSLVADISSSSPTSLIDRADKEPRQTSSRNAHRWMREEKGEEEEREHQEEIARELEEQREAYDKPDEGAEYLLHRRLPEGETTLRYELYLEAMERMRDLPQYSTVQGTLLPSRREMAKSSEPNTGRPLLEKAALPSWNSLGPGNVGGRTRALLIHPRTPDVMFAGGASGGVWRTTDGGRNWTPLTDLLPNLAVNALAFDPTNPDTIYAGTGEGYFNADATRGAGIFRSFDGGNTWRRLEGAGTREFYYVNDIVVSGNNRNRIYAATGVGVMRSLDGGATWARVVNEESNGGCSDLAMRTDSTTDVVFAACGIPKNPRAPGSVQATIYRNNNAAVLGIWDAVYSEEGMSRTSLAIAPSNQNVIYAVSSENGARGAPNSLHGVFRSTNGGEPGGWIKVNDGSSNKLNASLFTNPYFAFLNECRPGASSQNFNQGWYDNTIAVDPLNENVVWVGGIDLFRSDDGGANWGMASFWQEEKTSTRYVHADQHVIAFHPQFNGSTIRTMYVGTDGGIFRTDNARAQTVNGNRAPCSPELSRVGWASLNNGYAVTQFYHGAAFPGGESYLGGAQDNGVVTGSDEFGPNNWRELLSGDGGYVAVDPFNPLVVYAEGTGLSLKKSTEGGRNFTPATTGISNIGFGFIAPLTMDPSDPTRLWIGGVSLWRTKNGAESWSQASPPLNGTTITAIGVAPTDSNFVLAGTDQGYIHRTTTGVSSNADSNWPSALPRSGTVTSLAFDPTNRDIAYATYSNFGGKHVWRSLDRGQSWQPIDTVNNPASSVAPVPLPDIPVNCLVVDPTNTQRLYLGTDLGVFATPDGGITWAVENTGFANVPVEWLSINAYKGAANLFAFTRGRGVWRVPLGQVCTNSLSPASQTFDSSGGLGSVNVQVSGGDCLWDVENKTDWITITSTMPMRGNGTVKFSVSPSPNRQPRTGTFTVAGNSFTVTQAGDAASVSAATLAAGPMAPESIVAAFGSEMAQTTQIASIKPLPTSLFGTTVKVLDYLGTERLAPLSFISPTQINYLIPKDTETGPATVTIYNGKDKLFNCKIEIQKVAPGLFTADGSGRGVPVGQALRLQPSVPGSELHSELLYMLDDTKTRLIPRPIDLGPDLGPNTDRVFLVLYGTGIRNNTSASATIGGEAAPVSFAGAQPDFEGLDQINIEIPHILAGRGEVELILTVNGLRANPVKISIQ